MKFKNLLIVLFFTGIIVDIFLSIANKRASDRREASAQAELQAWRRTAGNVLISHGIIPLTLEPSELEKIVAKPKILKPYKNTLATNTDTN